MSEEACSFFWCHEPSSFGIAKSDRCGSVGNHSIWMYPATSSKSRSVTSFACRALAPCTRMTRTKSIRVHWIMAQEKQVPLPISLLRVPVGSQLHFGTSNVHVGFFRASLGFHLGFL